MKTTVDIADALLARAKKLAARRGTTLKALIEAGLQSVLQEEKHRGKFALRDESVGGDGLRPEWRDRPWDDVRDAAYEGRGG
jgi:hypothetical protein